MGDVKAVSKEWKKAWAERYKGDRKDQRTLRNDHRRLDMEQVDELNQTYSNKDIQNDDKENYNQIDHRSCIHQFIQSEKWFGAGVMI